MPAPATRRINTLPSWRRLPACCVAFALAGWLLALSLPADAADLTNLWAANIGDATDSSPAIAPDGTIYIGTFHGLLWALKPDGTRKWTFAAKREIRSAPAVAPDGTVYFGSRDHCLYAVRPDGRKRWSFHTGGWVDASPAIGADSTVYAASWDKHLYALRPDGSRAWQFRAGGEIASSPAINLNGNICFGAHDGNFYAVTPGGTQAWSFAAGGPIISSPAIGQDGTLYFSSVSGFFYALTAEGQPRWKSRTGGVTESSPVIGPDGVIYIGANHQVLAFAPDGRKLWEHPCPTGLPIHAPPLVLADGSVCFISEFGLLTALDAQRQPRWTFYLGGYREASPAVSPAGTIYIGGRWREFFALPGGAALARSPWPKFRGDAANTGRATPPAPPSSAK